MNVKPFPQKALNELMEWHDRDSGKMFERLSKIMFFQCCPEWMVRDNTKAEDDVGIDLTVYLNEERSDSITIDFTTHLRKKYEDKHNFDLSRKQIFWTKNTWKLSYPDEWQNGRAWSRNVVPFMMEKMIPEWNGIFGQTGKKVFLADAKYI